MIHPTGRIVFDRKEWGIHHQIEELQFPLLRGAGLRRYRLWENGNPAIGNQYHYDLESAVASAQYLLEFTYNRRIEWLELRVSQLESERYQLINQLEASCSILKC